jgi:membrane associated rhomboid family serine protease
MALPQPPVPQTATCYRHPNREAGRRCTRCGRPACSDCLVTAPVGSHCLECAKASRPDVATRARYWNARQPTLVTFALILANVAVFLWLVLQDSTAFSSSRRATRGQVELGLIDEYATPFGIRSVLGDDGEWYRLVTSGFIHFGIIHLAFNMLLLFQLGQLLEPAIGRVRFFLVYVASLLGGSVGALLLQPNSLHGGASGAVFGLMGAAFVGLRNRGINPFSTGIGTTLILNLLITFTIPGISIGGHLGGIVAGAVSGYAVLAPRHLRVPTWASYAVPAGMIVLALLAAYVIGST